MRFVRWILRVLCAIGLLFFGFYTAIGIAIALFIMTGKFTPGERELFDGDVTPTLLQTVVVTIISASILALSALAYHKLAPRRPPPKASAVN